MRLPEDLATLGTADLELAGFKLWVHGRRFDDAPLPDDANWLEVTAYCAAPGARVWISGPYLSSSSFAHWLTACERLRNELRGEAELQYYEPNIRILLASEGRAGHVLLAVSLTPDHLHQQHRFEFEIDQSYLEPLIAQIRAILGRYPVPPSSCERDA